MITTLNKLPFTGIQQRKIEVTNKIGDPALIQQGFQEGKVLEHDETTVNAADLKYDLRAIINSACIASLVDGVDLDKFNKEKGLNVKPITLTEADVFNPDGTIKDQFVGKPCHITNNDHTDSSVSLNKDGTLEYEKYDLYCPENVRPKGKVALKESYHTHIDKKDMEQWDGELGASGLWGQIKEDKYVKLVLNICETLINDLQIRTLKAQHPDVDTIAD